MVDSNDDVLFLQGEIKELRRMIKEGFEGVFAEFGRISRRQDVIEQKLESLLAANRGT